MMKQIVKICEGCLRGQQKINSKNRIFLSFEGIPYAEPPVGTSRFKPPVPVKPWKGIKDALQIDAGNLCQNRRFIRRDDGGFDTEFYIAGSENSLNLNVYTHSVENDMKMKPVMFFIHGGAFTMGNTGKYGPEHLMNEDIVLVTIHYRLGAFGFLVLEDPDLNVTGNAALKDMVLALKWVQRNIKFFNGDAGNVTIFGQSAGAAAVNLLVLSPMSSGLFHKAIMQSGCAINYWAKGSKQNGKKLAEILGFQGSSDKEILEFLQSLPAEEVYEGQLKLGDTFHSSCLRYFAPVVETKHCKNAFLTEEPIELIKSGKFNHVPIILGYTDMEAMILLLEFEGVPSSKKFSKDSALVPFVLGVEENTEEFKQISSEIRNFYFGENEPELISRESIIFFSDNLFIRGVLRTAQHLGKISKEPVYLYRFSTPMINIPPFSSKNLTGVPHNAENSHLFKRILEPKHVAGNELIVREWFIKLWTNFAKHSDPTFGKDDLIEVKWKPVKNRLEFLDIGNELKMDVEPEKERMRFWDDLFSKFHHAEDY